MIKLKNILLESPDNIRISKEHLNLDHNDSDTLSFAFFYRTNRVYISDFKKIHYEIGKYDTQLENDLPKKFGDDGDITGRLWVISKIISFYECPDPNKIKAFIIQLNKDLKRRNFDFKITLKWRIDVDVDAIDINNKHYFTEGVITLGELINRTFLPEKIKINNITVARR